MTRLLKPEIANLIPSVHGGPDYGELERLGISPDELLDFSVNSNPLGAPPEIRETLSQLAIERYPDSEAIELCRCLSQKIGAAIENILLGNGSVELIRLIAQAYFGPEDLILIIEPTFGEYEVASRIVGSRIIKQTLPPERGFRIDALEMARFIQQHQPKGIFICNPNNPTGQYLSRQEMDSIIGAAENGIIVLDEAYIPFVDDPWSSLDMTADHNLIVLRTMTKDYALAGLRLGYAIARPDIISDLHRVRPPWNVNVVAQRAGVIALENDNYLERARGIISRSRGFLTAELAKMGLPTVPSQTNYFLAKVGDAPGFRLELLRRRMLVRDCTSFGLPEYVRISVRTLPDCRKLVRAIKEVVRA